MGFVLTFFGSVLLTGCMVSLEPFPLEPPRDAGEPDQPPDLPEADADLSWEPDQMDIHEPTVDTDGETDASTARWVLRATFPAVHGILCLKAFRSYLYAGTSSDDSKVYRSLDGENWTLVESLNDGNVNCLEVHDGYLYAGTQTRIWRSADGVNWSLDFIHPDARTFHGMASHAPTGRIYACSSNSKIFRRDGLGWIVEHDYGAGLMWDIFSDGTDLYCTTADDGRILKGSGSGRPLTWTVDYTPPEAPKYTLGLAMIGPVIYAGSREMPMAESGGNGRVYKKEGGTWSLDRVFDEPQVIVCLEAGSTFYVGTGKTLTGGLLGNIYKKSGGAWSLDFNTNREMVYALEVWNSAVYAGTNNEAAVYAYIDF